MAPADPIDRPPHKRLRLKLDLEGHDLDDLTDRLHDILTRLIVDKRETTSRISGTYELDLTCDSDMTRERYEAELTAWVRRREEARRAD